jgi:hypothetical protein
MELGPHVICRESRGDPAHTTPTSMKHTKCGAGYLPLLRPWLSPEQVEQFSSYKYFDVIGSHTGKRYRIRRGTSMNIDELDSAGNKVCAWCLLPEETWLPVTSCSHRKSRWRLSRATLWLSQTESADRGLPDCGHRFVP